MKLLPGWSEKVEQATQARTESVRRRLLVARPDVSRLSGEVQVALDVPTAEAFLRALEASPVAALAVDSEYRFGRPSVELRSGKRWFDIRSIQPICFSLAAWVPDPDGNGSGSILAAVLDMRKPGLAEVLGRILRLRVPLVAHHIKAELTALWSLGLDPELHQVFDTYLAGACLQLGRHHKRSLGDGGGNVAAEIQGQTNLALARTHSLSLVGQCARYGLDYPFSESKDEHRARFMHLGPGEDLSPSMVDYAVADAEWTLRLYVAQQSAIIAAGAATHLYTVEFPFAVANARIEWHGVYVDPDRRSKALVASRQASEHYAATLRELGIANPASAQQFLAAMTRAGLASKFVRNGQASTDDKVLEKVGDLHPAVTALRQYRRYSRLANDEWMTGELDGADGRVHPDHFQLGAATGRNSCARPNLVGIGKVLRPMITAPPGRALIEADYAQIEVGVAAAEYGDPDLLAAFNAGDVYSAMAQRFCAHELSEEERALAPGEFKQRRRDLRDKVKVFVLAVIYNMQAPAIASHFGIDVDTAERERARFLGLFPVLERRLDEVAAAGFARGYAVTVTGLRRLIEPGARLDGWNRNLLRNTPVQGSAADVFKLAVVWLDRAFRGTSAFVVLPIHDAVLIECDHADVAAVSARTKQIMEDAVRHFYPALRPKVEINAVDTTCWNKDGHSNSLDRFLEDPTYTIGAAAAIEQLPDWLEFDMDDPGPGVDAALDADLRRLMAERGVSLELAEWHERFDERAAIREFDVGQDRVAAEAGARAEVIAAFEESLGAHAEVDPQPDPFVAEVLGLFGGVVDPVAPFRAEAELDATGMVGAGGGERAGGRT